MSGPLGSARRVIIFLASAILLFYTFSQLSSKPAATSFPGRYSSPPSWVGSLPDNIWNDDKFHWVDVPQRYPVQEPLSLPTSRPVLIPPIQYKFKKEVPPARYVRERRLEAVRGNFTHAWRGYINYAFMHDELRPVSGEARDNFGGWAATLIDALDTLWILEFYEDFDIAVQHVERIDFSQCEQETISVFETTIRHLGGLLAAYDISGWDYPSLLFKAIEVGDMLYRAFDTPNRMPVSYMNIEDAANGAPLKLDSNVPTAVLGSMTLEFTRLSQVTGNPKYYDAVQRVMSEFDAQQEETNIPGMWPVMVNPQQINFKDGSQFSIGALADSHYEYLPKEWLLLNGAEPQYHKLWDGAYNAMENFIFYRPNTKTGESVLLPGTASAFDRRIQNTSPEAQHLGCFAGGIVGLAAKIFGNDSALDSAEKLTKGCLWGYEVMEHGIMPETIHTLPCTDRTDCTWDESAWHDVILKGMSPDSDASSVIRSRHLGPGVVRIDDARYILRPEAIESAFILYRITGDQSES